MASRLQTLEENGIISKSDHPESKTKVLYKLTEKGIDLLPVIIEIGFWADKYYDINPTKKAELKEMKKGKDVRLTRSLSSIKD